MSISCKETILGSSFLRQISKVRSPNSICSFTKQYFLCVRLSVTHEEPHIDLLHEILLSVLNKLLSKFFKTENVPEDLCAIDVDNRPIHLLKENVLIRLATRQLLEELEEYREIGMVERDIVFEFY